MRPGLPSGIQIGDVRADSAIVWGRADRPARLVVEHASNASFREAVTVRGGVATQENGFVARLDLSGLAPDREVLLRVRFEDLESGRARSAPVDGRFRTAPAGRRNVRFVWSADTAGQGYGIDPERGGMRTYEAMRQVDPDFFVHCGDTIYADAPIAERMELADGSVWRSLVTADVAVVAESLAQFRGRYAYNLLDAHVQRFSAEVPQVWLWDDHEVVNNWSDAKDLSADARYTEKRVAVLAERARRAFLDYAPLRYEPSEEERIYRHVPYGPLLDVFALDARSYRGPNSANRQAIGGPATAFLGAAQLTWLEETLAQSSAVWKVIASDMPIGLVVPDELDSSGRPATFEAVANADGGPPLGRELEIAHLLRSIREHGVRNVVWITGDVHYTAAHRYDPARARFTGFDPFWEFASGPLHAGSFGPSALDDTFGPQVVFQRASPIPNAPPSAGYQFFGQVDIDGATAAMTVTLKDVSGASLFTTTLEPAG
ncbi:MAG: alkaline phosphatase [Acidimicrobiia bacterium]|nr:alkaline phosphatase [Acidimicrobiia bacterium]